LEFGVTTVVMPTGVEAIGNAVLTASEVVSKVADTTPELETPI
jgi:hypothetical protein